MNEPSVKLKAEAGTKNTLECLYRLCEPKWSWYEPRPESLIETNTAPPLITFFRGKPDIPEGIEFSELLLFGEGEGLTAVPDDNGYRYFHWREDQNGTLETLECRKTADPAFLKPEAMLENQFGFTSEQIKQFPAINTFTLIQYFDQSGNRVAWTIEGKEE